MEKIKKKKQKTEQYIIHIRWNIKDVALQLIKFGGWINQKVVPYILIITVLSDVCPRKASTNGDEDVCIFILDQMCSVSWT